MSLLGFRCFGLVTAAIKLRIFSFISDQVLFYSLTLPHTSSALVKASLNCNFLFCSIFLSNVIGSNILYHIVSCYIDTYNQQHKTGLVLGWLFWA